MRTRFTFVLLAISTVLGCAAKEPPLPAGVQVTSVADPKANLKAFHTFAWGAQAAGVEDPSGAWKAPNFSVMDEAAYQIEKALRARGIMPVREHPDAYVVFLVVASIDQEKAIEEQNPELKVGSNAGSEGALVVLLVDPDSLKPVWRGNLIAPLRDDLTDGERRQRVARAVDEVFKQFPR